MLKESDADLLEESQELAGAPLVRFGQVEILEIEDQVLTVFGPVDAASVGTQYHAHLL